MLVKEFRISDLYPMYTTKEQRFITWCTITLVALFLLILAGGVVRSTGSGMGCPDWPKCFGRYIPPTDVSELPQNYREIYSHRGFSNTDFNVFKTWTEYINRLIGALTGFFLFLTLFFARPYLKSNKKVFWYTFAAFILTGFQAWVGAKVVQTNLKAYIVTIHMLIALLILALILVAYWQAKKKELQPLVPALSKYSWVLILLLILTTIQIVLGTAVRERLDELAVASENGSKGLWLQQAGEVLNWHKTWAISVLLPSIFLLWLSQKEKVFNIYRLALMNMALLLLQFVLGITLTAWTLPPVSQALHIFVATLLFGLQFSLVLLFYHRKGKE